MSTVLRLEGVNKEYRTGAEVIHAVADVSLTVSSGKTMALVGPSGSGKTTLVHLIAGWELPTSGVVERDPALGSGWSSVAVVPQGIGLLEELPVVENVELPARLGNSQHTTTAELMSGLGLEGLEHRLPLETSLGEQQRAAVARAVASRPGLLIADEPTAHQDEMNAARVRRVLEDCANHGSAVLVATHDPRILPYMDELVRLEYGRLTTDGV